MNSISIVAGIIYLLSFIPYVLSILRGSSKPQKSTWLIWATTDVLSLFSIYKLGTINGLIAGGTTGAIIILCLAIKYGTSGWKRTDTIVCGISFAGLICWATTSDAFLGLCFFQSACFVGSIPTFISAWKSPEDEDFLTWGLFAFSCILQLISVEQWSWNSGLQPVTFAFIDNLIFVFVFRGRVLHKIESRVNA